MCGIVGYVGGQNCAASLLDGLERLEYRGYDSAGIAVHDGQRLHTRKASGRLAHLRELWESDVIDGQIGIGHTRWATHGDPNDVNAHPHTNADDDIAIVHNGIIENYYALKQRLEAKGVIFRTQTDSEVIVQLFGYYYAGDMKETLMRVLPMLEGSFGLAILDAKQPDTLYCARRNSPLVMAKGEGAYFLASDIPAILPYSRDIIELDDMEMAALSAEGIQIWDELGNPIAKMANRIDWDVNAAEKGGFPHFMLKEINEEPEVLARTLEHYLVEEEGRLAFRREAFAPLRPLLNRHVKRIHIVACGTAYHAGMVGKRAFEQALGVPVNVEIASEFRYSDSPLYEDDLFIAISQSGETADTLAAVKMIKERDIPCIALCNVMGSSIAKAADAVLYTLAGPEIAVASTKAYTTQLLLLQLLASYLGERWKGQSEAEQQRILSALWDLPRQARLLLGEESVGFIQRMANQFFDCKSVFFIGRGMDWATAQEAALKLKEISYIHSESYAAGELKHGTIALVEPGTLVVALATQAKVRDKMLSNVEEVRARGARILLLLPEGAAGAARAFEGGAELLLLPDSAAYGYSILSIIPMQLFAYFMALEKGCDIDKPRNLAKSVTVE